VIPTYNEAENIPELLRRILTLDPLLRVIVVDDDSPDGTAEAARRTGGERVSVLVRKGVRGYGGAVVAGYKEALAQGADLILGMDSDFSHDPARIPELLRQAEQADVVVGSRYCPNGGTINWPLYRMLLSRTANRYVQLILGIPCHDATSGFRCYRREIVENLDLDTIRSEGYSFLVEVLYRAFLAGARISEIPIVFMDRLRGKSKISTKEIYRSIFMVLWLRWTHSRRHSSHVERRTN
ncbi:MAG: polyprenol monophosphomannose synthase, partial [Candidatus Omnitrophica bacterium]|nr:polyprenol monophosphomannose synthase [Candidatus Omnitrophota bacterium]